jgi:hypothetical protein
MNTEDFICILKEASVANYNATVAYTPSYRLGQSYVSCLARTDTSLYSKMMQNFPDADCFYDDRKIDAFLKYIQENYNEQEN